MSLTNLHFDRTTPSARTHPAGENGNGSGRRGGVHQRAHRGPEDDLVRLAVSKAVGQLGFIARSYTLALFDASIDDLRADLETMLRQNDLSSIRLELLGQDRKVLFEFKLHFNVRGRNADGVLDTGRGVELPVLDQRLVAGKRLVVQRRGLEWQYKHLLRLNWGTAREIEKCAGAAYRSDHASKISGGRQAASFHVGNVARHRFVLTQTGTKGFGFARDVNAGLDGVFVLASQVPADVEFRIGGTFTGLLVQTPRGLQVRSIRGT